MWLFTGMSGLVIYPLIILSIVSVGIFIERFFSIREKQFINSNFLIDLNRHIKGKNIPAAIELCKKDRSPFSNIIHSILNNLDMPLSRLLEVAEEAGRHEIMKQDKYLQTLKLITTIAPLLGLLGTVLGMMQVFFAILDTGYTDMQYLSSGIAVALVTTAAGLIVAIPTAVFYHIIEMRITAISVYIEKNTSSVINLIFKE